MYSTANGHLQQQPVQGAQMPNDLDLKVKFRTDKCVYLSWNPGRHVLEDYPYKLQYLTLPIIRVGITQPIQIPGNLFYTVKELKIPRDQDGGAMQLVARQGYRFILSAKEKNKPNGILYGVADVQMAGEPCTETIQAILESQDFMQNFATSVDPCPKLHQAISGRFKVQRKDYKNIRMYADGSRKRITEELLQLIAERNTCEANENRDEKIQVCHLLQVVKEYGPVSVMKDLFEWHTGRADDCPGPCEVCTREYFG